MGANIYVAYIRDIEDLFKEFGQHQINVRQIFLWPINSGPLDEEGTTESAFLIVVE